MKLSKKILILSFIPYLLILLYGIISIFTGISFFYSTTYGSWAFVIGVIAVSYALTFMVPIIPVCMIYQICYLFRNTFKNVENKKYIKTCLIVGLLVVGAIFIYSHSFDIDKFFEKESAMQMIKNADEKIGFNESEIKIGGIFNIPEYTHSHILIDYDNMEVGMLLNSGLDAFWKVKLNNTTKDSSEYQRIINTYYMQADIPLSNPGKRLISFYEDKPNMHRTIAFLLFYNDGTIYYADNIKEKRTGYTRFSGLKWSKYFVGENKKYNGN